MSAAGSDAAALQAKVDALEARLAKQAKQHAQEVESLQKELGEMHRLVQDLETCRPKCSGEGAGVNSADLFKRRVEWTIVLTEKEKELQKGTSLWSPKFSAAGMDGLQLEFFPKGREKTTFDGFCSLFLWCPSGTKLKYQLFVGSFLRAPDEDEYTGRIGHGHSNFCPLAPELSADASSVVVGVNFIEVRTNEEPNEEGLRVLSTPMEVIMAKEAEISSNKGVNRVVWKINKISERAKHLPRGASMWSKLFTAAGIREVLLEFYPNGSTNTTKEGFCAFYIRCPEGVSLIVTLFVGRVRKGPIKTTFDSLTGKGLPDFCLVEEQLNKEDDSIEVGIELQNQPAKTLQLES